VASTGFVVEPIFPAHCVEDESVVCECEDGQVLEHGYCLHRRKSVASGESARQLYSIYSVKGVKSSPHRALLMILWSNDHYTTAVMYTRRDKRSGEELNKAICQFLNDANLVKTISRPTASKPITENAYGVMQLMERDIRLSCGSRAHLMTYQTIKSPHLFTISLQDPFTAKVSGKQ
jgi:hypothetical protein